MISLKNLANLQGRFCHYCRSEFCPSLLGATRDHVIPKVRGGSDRIENLVLSCVWCNTRKAEMDYDDFMEILPKILYERWGNDPRIAEAEAEAGARTILIQPLVHQPKAAEDSKYRRSLSNAQNKLRWSAEKFPAAEADGHVRGPWCVCRPKIVKIRGGWVILEHQEIQLASGASRQVIQ